MLSEVLKKFERYYDNNFVDWNSPRFLSCSLDEQKYKLKQFITEQISKAINEVMPIETRMMKMSNPDRRCGFAMCIQSLKENKDKFLNN